MDDHLEENKPVQVSTVSSTEELSKAKQAREAKKLIVIEYLSKLPVYKWAAAAAGISKDTLEDWRKEDQEFSARCESAKAEAIKGLGRRATPDFILKNVDPETFKDKKEMEVTLPKPLLGGLSDASNNGHPKDK